MSKIKETLTYLYVSILTDFGFKKTFGNKNNLLFLKKAIQALIQTTIPIESITLSFQVVPGLTEDSRGGVFDISCVDKEGTVYIVELQMYGFLAFIQRAKFYAFHSFNDMVEKGSDFDFKKLKKIYVISFLNGNIFDNTDDYHHKCCLRSEKGLILDDQITHVVVELKKFNKIEEECITDLDKLLYFMKLSDTITDKKQLPKFHKEGWLKQTLDIIDVSSLSKEELAEYEKSKARSAMYSYYLNTLEENEQEIKKKDAQIKQKDAQIEQKDAQIEQKDAQIEQKDAQIEQKDAQIEQKDAQIEQTILGMLRSGLLTKNQIAHIAKTTLENVNRIEKKYKNGL